MPLANQTGNGPDGLAGRQRVELKEVPSLVSTGLNLHGGEVEGMPRRLRRPARPPTRQRGGGWVQVLVPAPSTTPQARRQPDSQAAMGCRGKSRQR